ncbi:MAG TPA: class I SAM-dependent methyltransferase [Terriglobia bacterium]|nr:class I SAM-dependent methyltransferase [Terriglobia bacterium]
MTSDNYFLLRRINADHYTAARAPAYLMNALRDRNAAILDFGCGFGQLIADLQARGYTRVEGADVSPEAISHLRDRRVTVHDLTEETDFYESRGGAYDYVIMSHVLEHFPKDAIINQLKRIRQLLKPGGALLVMAPNAQAHTGAYWAYEDFTHHTLFTTGSLYFVLMAAGFRSVEFLDPDCTADVRSPLKRAARKVLLRIYRFNVAFWNRVTGSAFHAPSPQIFSYEIKALARV